MTRVHLLEPANLIRGLALLLLARACLAAPALSPLADAHGHYKRTQTDHTSPAHAVAILKEAGVDLAVVFGTPPDQALHLKALAPEGVIPVFGPYAGRRDRVAWQFDPGPLEEARQALASGLYHGIGEMHLVGGFSSRLTENPLVAGLMKLGATCDAPLIIPSEFSSPEPFIRLCTRHPDTPVVLDYPGRFMVGSDNVWPVDPMDAWDQPDTGWDELPRFLDFHRGWLAELPAEVATKVAHDNVERLFGRPR